MKEAETRKDFEEYFREDLAAIEEELAKSKEYSEIIDKEIKKFTNNGIMTKGGEHYLIEHITNAVQLQTQRQGLRKDRVAIKKLIMDYTNKAEDKNKDASSEASILDAIKALQASMPAKQEIDHSNDDLDLDSEIDDILSKDEK